VLATIPAGITGLLLEHSLRTLFANPLAAAVFLTLNGLILLTTEHLRRRAPGHRPVTVSDEGAAPARVNIAIGQQVSRRDAGVIGVLQTFALLPGISRSGVTMSGGLLRGLTHEEAVHFSFLLATPIILAAGLLKVPDLVGPLGNGIRAQVAVGSVTAFVSALVAARFLQRWFRTRTLVPFAVYCLVAGGISSFHFA
jgi:undecaprenyl-diphosphatase